MAVRDTDENMPVISPSKVSSFSTLARTLSHDFYAWRWFSCLLAQPLVKAALVSEKDMRAQYRVLVRIEKQELLSAALFLLALAGMLTPYRMFSAAVLALGWWLSSYFTGQKKAVVLKLSTCWLQREFLPEDFEQKTLFQISEIISKKYQIPSLVDSVYFSDSVFRILYLAWFLFLLVPYPIPNFFLFVGFSVLGVVWIRNMLNSRRIYQNHKIIDVI